MNRFYCVVLLLLILFDVVLSMDKGFELLKAAEHGDTDKLLELLNSGVPMYTRNNFGVSPIIFAANNGHSATLAALLDRDAHIEDRSNNGRTPLIWASRWGHYDTVKLLIDRGANISAIDIDGMTPLMHSVSNDHIKVVELLIDRGAPITAKNFHDGTALSIAKVKGNQEIINMIEHHFPTEHNHSLYYIIAHHLYLYFEKMTLKGYNRARYHLGLTSSMYMEEEL